MLGGEIGKFYGQTLLETMSATSVDLLRYMAGGRNRWKVTAHRDTFWCRASAIFYTALSSVFDKQRPQVSLFWQSRIGWDRVFTFPKLHGVGIGLLHERFPKKSKNS